MTQDTLTKHIQLNVFLGKTRIAQTGGQAKIIIRSGNVIVNKQIETRNKKKLHAGDVIEFLDKKYEVEEKYLR